MSTRTYNSDEIAKLKQLVTEGIQVNQELDALKEGLRETVKAIAEELDTKPSVLNKAIKTAYKRELHAVQDDMAALEDILQATGHTE
tara:strand:- start:2444 stop:2704 length:261 start_codon:yes stop_codon:yes gene_type:complete